MLRENFLQDFQAPKDNEDEDIEKNASKYTDLLLGCLNRLDKIQEGLEVIQQRTSGELRRVTEELFEVAEQKLEEPGKFMRHLSNRFLHILEMYRLVYDKVSMVMELVH